MKLDRDALGKLAYEAWCGLYYKESTIQVDEWERVSPVDKAPWCDSAEAVARAVLASPEQVAMRAVCEASSHFVIISGAFGMNCHQTDEAVEALDEAYDAWQAATRDGSVKP